MVDLIKGEGPIPCRGMIIGEAPGKEEDKLGRPFVGKSGEILEEAFAVVGISREDVYITNAYKSRPPNNRPPNDKELSSHALILQREISKVKPKVIMTLGAVATQQFVPLDRGIVAQRGVLRGLADMVVLPTIHPSFVLRSRKVRFELFLEDMLLFARVANLVKE